MVKKVIDIWPPAKAKKEEPRVLKTEKFPVVEAKPKITYVPKKAEMTGKKKNRISRPFFGTEKRSPLAGFLAKAAFVLAMFFLAAFLIDMKMAKATITIWPETEALTSETPVTVDVNAFQADAQKGVIPGKVITAEKTYTEEFSATGSKNNQNRAGGTVKIYNNYTSPQRLVKGTRLQAPAEKFQPALAKDESPWFRTVADVVLPAKASADVQVVADGAGEKYNIEPSIFSVPGLVGTAQYTFIYGQSFEKFGGGEKGSVLEIKQEDIDAAKDVMAKKADEEIRKELAVSTPGSFALINETVKVESEESAPSANAGTVADKFNYRIKVKASGVIFDRTQLDNMGKEIILGKAPENQKIYEPSLKIDYSYLVPADTKVQTAPSLTLKAAAQTYLPVNEAELKRGLAEKKITEAKFFLVNQPKVKGVEIKPSPFWRTSVPKSLDRIDVNVSFE